MSQSVGEVLVEEVSQELAHAQVGPAAVHQQEALKVAELREGEVAGEDGLHALLSTDADTDVSGCRSESTNRHVSGSERKEAPPPPLASAQSQLTFDHADVVSSVSDGQGDGLLVLLDQLHHLGLLQGRDPAADDGLAHARQPQQLQRVVVQRKRLKQSRGSQIPGQCFGSKVLVLTRLCPLMMRPYSPSTFSSCRV